MSTHEMKTKRIYHSYYVAVEVDLDAWIAPSDPEGAHQFKIRRLEEAAASIRRHVDDLEGVAVRYETETICVYCGTEAEDAVDAETGEVACCNEAQREWIEATQ